MRKFSDALKDSIKLLLYFIRNKKLYKYVAHSHTRAYKTPHLPTFDYVLLNLDSFIRILKCSFNLVTWILNFSNKYKYFQYIEY